MSETFGGKDLTTVCRILMFVWSTFVSFHKACRGPLITYHLMISKEPTGINERSHLMIFIEPTESTENIHLVISRLLRTSEKHEHNVQLTADTAMCVGCVHHSAPGMYISHSLPTPFSLSHTHVIQKHTYIHTRSRVHSTNAQTHIDTSKHRHAGTYTRIHRKETTEKTTSIIFHPN